MNESWIFSGVLLLLYFYSDYHYRRRLEKKDEFIKDLEVKFMSKDVTEYTRAVEEEPQEAEQEKDPYVEIDDLENIKTIEEIERLDYKI